MQQQLSLFLLRGCRSKLCRFFVDALLIWTFFFGRGWLLYHSISNTYKLDFYRCEKYTQMNGTALALIHSVDTKALVAEN